MYIFVVIISLVLSLLGVILFYPIYTGNMFPLYTDIFTLLFFLPSYFILTFSIVGQLISLFLKNSKIKVISLLCLYIICFVIARKVLPFSSAMFNIVLFLESLIGIVKNIFVYLKKSPLWFIPDWRFLIIS